ncbi:MAG TPA: hypothetical protein V6C81_11875 [Planktothrix sp.]|jgi:hypothetical protein
MPEKSLLDELMIAAPCQMSWQEMEGDEKKRLCHGCHKHVYNISEMTRKEANKFLLENGTTECMRLYRRADGTIITNNCPVGLRKLKQKIQSGMRLVAGFASLFLGFAPACKADSQYNQPLGLPAPVAETPKKELQSDGAVKTDPNQWDSRHGYLLNYAAGSPKFITGRRNVATAGKPAVRPFSTIDPIPQNAVLPQHVAPPGLGLGADDPLATTAGIGGAVAGNNKVLLHANYNVIVATADKPPVRADDAALQLWQKGKQAEAQGKILLTLAQFKDALKACAKQLDGDPVFKRFLEGEVERMANKVKEMQ